MTIISRRSSRRRAAGILTGIAFAFAFAFALLVAALPATAGAATLNYEGVPAEEGTTVSMASGNPVFVLQSPVGPLTIKCSRLDFRGIVTVNTGGNVVVAPDEEASTLVGCSANGATLELTPKFEGINLSGSTGTASFTLTGGGLSEASTSTVSWVGPEAEEAHVEGVVTGTLPLSFSADCNLVAGDGTPLTLT